MANFTSYASVILIIILACLSTLTTEGRPLKSMKKSDDDIHHRSDQKNEETKLITTYRPTMPGKSPDASHSLMEHRVDDQSKALVNFANLDPSSTQHGHSPGAGHSVHN
ncbi:hypothetical protein R6Q59_014007 [Mikania micrantha]